MPEEYAGSYQEYVDDMDRCDECGRPARYGCHPLCMAS